MSASEQTDFDAAMEKSARSVRVTTGDVTIQRANPKDLIELDKHQSRKLSRANGSRPFLSGIDMTGAI